MLDFGEDVKTFQLIVGCILALGFLIIAIYGLRKKWKGKYIACCLLASIFMFLISLDWVQGFVQTQAFTSLLRASKQYGVKLNEFQRTTGEMKVQLRQHQDEIYTQQKRLHLQQDQVSEAQEKIKIQQKSIDVQHQKIIIQQESLDSQERELAGIQNRLVQGSSKSTLRTSSSLSETSLTRQRSRSSEPRIQTALPTYHMETKPSAFSSCSKRYLSETAFMAISTIVQ
jgi:hypothetical protein